eukprot:4700726-Amphidinium_carterae.1
MSSPPGTFRECVLVPSPDKEGDLHFPVNSLGYKLFRSNILVLLALASHLHQQPRTTTDEASSWLRPS